MNSFLVGTNQSRLRVGVVGCGFIGAKHARAISKSDYAVLAASCDTDLSRAQSCIQGTEARAYSNLEEMLKIESLDAVTVATPDTLHAEPVIKSLEAGCHVFCEKPLAMSLDEAMRMSDTAVRSNRYLAVDYNRRFAYGYSKAYALFKAGKIGDVTHASLRVTDGKQPFEGTRGPYALLTTLLTHHIDLLQWFCGEVKNVHARCARPDSYGQFREVALSLEFENGAVGVIVGGWREGQKRTDEWAEIGGTLGDILIDDVQAGVRLQGLDADHAEVFRPDPFWTEDTVFYSSLTAHVLHFLECIHSGNGPSVLAQDGVKGLEMVAAAIKSHETGSECAV